MVGSYKVITLCGSTRFKDAFIAAQKRLTLAGNIVISLGCSATVGTAKPWTRRQRPCWMTCTNGRSIWPMRSM